MFASHPDGQGCTCKIKGVSRTALTPWYNSGITEAKTWRHKCERLYRRTKLIVHKDVYRAARLKLNSLIANSKLLYYAEKILHGCPNQETLFTLLDKVCHRKQVVLPNMPTEYFNDCFIQKITRVRNDVNEQVFDLPPELQELDPDEDALASPHSIECVKFRISS